MSESEKKTGRPKKYQAAATSKPAAEKKQYGLKESVKQEEKVKEVVKSPLTKEEADDLRACKEFMLTLYRQTNRVNVRQNMKRWMGLLDKVAKASDE